MEQENPLISVIIPCYRQAKFLNAAIESALAQTHSRIEIVVVDDGSPDETANVVAGYPDIRSVRQENQGLAGARNAGSGASKGEYVIFLDADDQLTANAAEAHLRCFAKHPKSGFVVGDIDHIGLDGSYCGSPRWPVLQDNFYEELLRVNHVANTLAVMFRRAVIEGLGGFDAGCSPAEDYDLLLRAARAWPSAHHRTVVAQYRRHPKSMSRNGVTMLRATNHVMECQRRIVAGDPKLERARRQGMHYWREHFGRATIRQIFTQLSRFQLCLGFRSTVALLWFVRGSLLMIPLNYALRVARRFAGCV